MSEVPPDNYIGNSTPSDTSDLLTAMAFIARQIHEAGWTATVVQVMAVYGGGPSAGPPLVDVQPLVNQINGHGQPTSQCSISKIPCGRIQTGTAAIVCDPQVGDIGLAIFADHDITSVIATGKQSNPGSWRRFDPSDGIYVITLIGAAPSSVSVTLSESGIVIGGTNGNLFVAGNLGAGNGVSGSFTTPTGQTVTVTNGIITNIY